MDVSTIFAICAGVTAAIVTGPFEFIKTRLQLENELHVMDDKYYYKKKGVFASIKHIVKHEGWSVFRVGLIPTCTISGITFAFRLSSYNYAFTKNLISTEHGVTLLHEATMFCGVTGIISQLICNPLHVIKTRVQNMAIVDGSKKYTSSSAVTIFRQIYRIHGIRGFFFGGGACVPRGFLHSVTQLYAYYAMKDRFVNSNLFYATYMEKCCMSATLGGIVTTVCIAPFDLVLTRLHNQPRYPSGRGLLYRNGIDCFFKIIKTEGFRMFFRGLGVLYLRIGPQTALSLIFWDVLREEYLEYVDHPVLRDLYLII